MEFNKALRIFPFICFAFILNFGSSSYGANLQVIASIHPVADMIREVGGKHVDVITVVPPGANPHTFELKPSIVKTFGTAKVFFIIGAGLEFWADKLIESFDLKLSTVVLSDNMSLIRTADSHHHEKPKETGVNKQVHSEPANPHIWLDPQLVKVMVKRIEIALSDSDPSNASIYGLQAKTFMDKLDALDTIISETVSKFRIKHYVAFHPSWDYFASRYGLIPAGSIEKTPGRNPTPKEIAGLVSRIKKFNIRAVFAEPQFNPKIAEVLAREAKVKVLVLDPLGGSSISDKNTYLNLMMSNLKIMKEAME